ncbi:MAG: TraR/DksA family transcriptional regulator [Candidatus Sumerlaeota bacterium]
MAKKKTTKKKTASKATKKSAKKAVKKSARKKTTKKTTRKKAMKKTARKTAKKTTKKKSAKKTTKKKAAKKTAKKTTKKKTSKKAAKKKAVKKAAKKSTKKTTKKNTAKKKVAGRTAPKRTPKAPPKTIKKNGKPSMRGIKLSDHKASGYYGGVLVCEEPGNFPVKSPHSEKNLKMLKKLLNERQQELLDTIRELDRRTLRSNEEGGQAKSTGYSIHIAEDAADNVETETSLLLRRDEEEALVQVDAALERLEEGLYGVCVACANKIGLARLRAVPEAHLCIECKQAYDKKQIRR